MGGTVGDRLEAQEELALDRGVTHATVAGIPVDVKRAEVLGGAPVLKAQADDELARDIGGRDLVDALVAIR